MLVVLDMISRCVRCARCVAESGSEEASSHSSKHESEESGAEQEQEQEVNGHGGSFPSPDLSRPCLQCFINFLIHSL